MKIVTVVKMLSSIFSLLRPLLYTASKYYTCFFSLASFFSARRRRDGGMLCPPRLPVLASPNATTIQFLDPH